jgi:hypothetical protein
MQLIQATALNYLEPPMHLAWLDGCVVKAGRQQFAYRPNVIGKRLRDRRRNAQRLMNAAEVVMRDIEADRSKMVIGVLAEPIG